MTRIKICGITRSQDALAAAASGADALGLVFYDKSPRHVSIQQAMQLAEAILPFVTLEAEAARTPAEVSDATMTSFTGSVWSSAFCPLSP